MLEKLLTLIKVNKIMISGIALAVALAISVAAIGISNNKKKNNSDESSVAESSSAPSSSESSLPSEPVVSEPPVTEPESSSQVVSSTPPAPSVPTPSVPQAPKPAVPSVPNNPGAVDAAYKATVHPKLENNPFFDSLVYTGYNINKHRADGLMWVYILASQKKAKGWLSGIEYGGACTGYETNSQGLPDIVLFKQKKKSLVCASFVTYVYFNYLPNVAKLDVSSLAKPDDPHVAHSWYLAARKWVDNGQAEFIDFSAVDRGVKADIKFTGDIPIGSIICFQDYYRRNGHCSHVAVYAGFANGYHWVFHVGHDNGPEFCAIERMNRGPDSQWPLAIISTPKHIREATGL